MNVVSGILIDKGVGTFVLFIEVLDESVLTSFFKDDVAVFISGGAILVDVVSNIVVVELSWSELINQTLFSTFSDNNLSSDSCYCAILVNVVGLVLENNFLWFLFTFLVKVFNESIFSTFFNDGVSINISDMSVLEDVIGIVAILDGSGYKNISSIRLST